MSCLFVEQLTVIDCAYLDSQRGLVGESWLVDLELEGRLDEQSMVLDFGQIKRHLKRAIDNSVDHTLLVPARDPGLWLHRTPERVSLEFRGSAAGPIEHHSPPQAVTLIEAPQIDAASVGAHLRALLAAEVPPNVSDIRLRLRNEYISGAYFHYTHGLKKHGGHCQRIAHGHRSRLEIEVAGHRHAELEQAQANRWSDIYLGTRSDLVHKTNGRLRFEYKAAEGDFAIELPESRCDLLESDTTIECIAEHLAQQLHREHPQRPLRVRAYEGVMKGAIATV
jgi:6-pyruvoyl-tetrahydropterin synthase